MKVFNFSDHNTVINNYLADLRDAQVQRNRAYFRHNIERIGQAMAYELSKSLAYQPRRIQTPLVPCEVSTITDRLVIGTVLRAGIAFHQGFLDVFDGADSAFISAYREEGTKEHIKIVTEYLAAPDLTGSTFIMVDPMLATGGSMALAYEAFTAHGVPAHLHLAAVIGAQEGIDHLQRIFPSDDVTLWIAAIDPELNDRAYIVPGLGDAGDLCFGDKLPR